jgi:hypothetical protein
LDKTAKKALGVDMTYDVLVQIAQGLAWDHVRHSGNTFKSLAEKSERNVVTVMRLAYGDTKNPRLQTITSVLKALDKRIAVVDLDASQQEDEVDVEDLQASGNMYATKGRREHSKRYQKFAGPKKLRSHK